MKTVNLREAKARLSSVIDDVQKNGAFVTVTRHGKPAAVLVPIDAAYQLEEGKPNAPIDNGAFIEHILNFPSPLEIDRPIGDFRRTDF